MKKRKSGRKKINWTEAFKYYCTSVNGRYPSYSDVASKYKVNKNTVWKVAQKEEWIKHRQKVDEKRSGVLVLGKNLRK